MSEKQMVSVKGHIGDKEKIQNLNSYLLTPKTRLSITTPYRCQRIKDTNKSLIHKKLSRREWNRISILVLGKYIYEY